DVQDLLRIAEERFEPPLLVALDGITDPRNLGAILRSADAFGAHGVILPERRSVSMTASVWKVAAGAAGRVRVAQVTNLNRTLTALKEQDVFALGLDAEGDVTTRGLELGTQPAVLVVGAEGKGLSRLARDICDQVVSIPMGGRAESLNASVAAAIALYEISGVRERQGLGWSSPGAGGALPPPVRTGLAPSGRVSWLTGPSPIASTTVAAPRGPPSDHPVSSTITSRTMRTGPTGRLSTRPRPVIRPSRGPALSCAPM